MTEVMDAASRSCYNGNMQEWIAWLHNLNTKPLPGGVSAAAMASAMGAALIAKALRASLKRQELGIDEQAAMLTTLELANQQQQALVNLAEADEEAYRAVLKTRVSKARARDEADPSESEVWRTATETPICVAEACRLLLGHLPALQELCWPVVKPDLDIARWLLEAGLRAGILAAESNLRACACDPDLAPLQSRIDALKPFAGCSSHVATVAAHR